MARETRNTRQKRKIRKSVDSCQGFFSADDIILKLSDDGIASATIYRFLSRARKEGTIHSYSCRGRTIYATRKTSHSHFTCKACGKTRHIDLKNLDFLKDIVDGDVCHIQLDVTGKCHTCKKSESP